MSVDRTRVQTSDSGANVNRSNTVARPSTTVSVGRDVDDTVHIPEGYNLRQDRVRWGPIFAGFLTALTSLLMLSLLGLAVGLTAASSAASQGNAPSGAGTTSAIWGAISGIISFLLGGYVAGRSASVFDRRWGMLNGAMVFFLGVPLTLWLAGQGLGAVLGTLGTFAGALNAEPGQVQNAAQGAANQARQVAGSVQSSDVARVADAARNGALGTLLGSLLALGSSAVGGYLGTRRTIESDRDV